MESPPQSDGPGGWWCLRALPAPNSIPELRPKHGLCICVTATLSAVSASLSSWPYSKFVFKVSCLQSITLTKVWLQMDWLASPPLLPTTIPTATQSPQSPRIRYPLCPLTACPLSSSRALQRPPVLRGFLDASPSPSGSQPPGGTKFLLTWTGCWLNPSALLLRVHADHPTVHAMSRHVMSRHTTPCHARVHR